MPYKKYSHIQVKTFVSSAFYTAIFLILLSGVFFVRSACAQTNEISEIYIEAVGNNKHEAKIKAHEAGMYRALIMIANKLQIPTSNLPQLPYHKMKSVFTPKVVLNEISLLEKYSATVTYSYDKGNLYGLLLEYGDDEINDLFYELLVIPVFRQNNKLYLWDEKVKWTSLWGDSRKLLDAHKIYLPEHNLALSEQITEKNIFSLSFDDFVNIFHDKFFKNVMIITAEFFTDRKTGRGILETKKYILKSYDTESSVTQEEYDLNSWEDISYNVDLSVDNIIEDYGVVRSDKVEEDMDEGHIFIDENEKKPIIMNFDVFDEEELELVIEKLENVDQIDSFSIERDYNTRYKILIYTSVSEYELAEGLYLNGLSYKIHGNLYNLIDVKKGI